MEIKEVIARARKYGVIHSIQRRQYPYTMQGAIAIVEQIGRAITPRFVIDGENRWVYEQLIKWMQADESMKAQDPVTGALIKGRLNAGIYIGGNTGSGKSLALQVMSIFRNVANLQVLINQESFCLGYHPVRVDSICDMYAQKGDITKFKRMPILCIQDLGAEQTETLYMGNRINVMQQLLEARGDRGDLITLISSNLPINHQRMVERYGSRVVSRLMEMCNYLELKGTDRRIIKS